MRTANIIQISMMISWHGNTFRINGHPWGKSISLTQGPVIRNSDILSDWTSFCTNCRWFKSITKGGSNTEFWHPLCCQIEQTIAQIFDLPVIWEAMTLMRWWCTKLLIDWLVSRRPCYALWPHYALWPIRILVVCLTGCYSIYITF